MKNRTIKGDIVLSYLSRWDGKSKSELAKKIYEENKMHFKDAEDARYFVRRYTGAHGEKSRIYKKNEPDGYGDHIKVLPLVLVLDIETLPLEVLVWGLYKQRISHENIVRDWCLLSWSAKWLFDPDTHSDILTPKEAIEKDDYRILSSLYKLIDRAEIIIAHNGARFDMRKIKARMLYHKMQQPAPYVLIDTLRATQREFATSSHRLDFLGKFTTNKGKIETNYALWRGCLNGIQESLDKMLEYNIMDVLLLEEVYLEIRGWIKSHPNMKLFVETDEMVCGTCGSNKIETAGYYYTPAGRYVAFRCKNKTCGAMNKSRISDLTKKERDKLLIGTAR